MISIGETRDLPLLTAGKEGVIFSFAKGLFARQFLKKEPQQADRIYEHVPGHFQQQGKNGYQRDYRKNIEMAPHRSGKGGLAGKAYKKGGEEKGEDQIDANQGFNADRR
ncbi:MAG: hypothetical protein V7679_11855 [Parasphingorhabdus sp.]